MAYVSNPRAGEWNQADQIWVDDVDTSVSIHPGHARFLVALIGLALSLWLYPLLTAAVIGVAAVGAELAGGMQLAGPVGLAVAAAPALAVYVLGMRAEQRLGTLAPYRWLRHAMRLAAPAAWLYFMVNEDVGAQGSSFVGGTVFVVVITQVVLWLAGWVRDDWHASLRVMRMRAASLPD
jgi:hypothetical protein